VTVQEPHLAWIAKLSVLETLPTGWEERAGDDGVMIYRNVETGRTTTEHPSDASFRALVRSHDPRVSLLTSNALGSLGHSVSRGREGAPP
jgi:hypothetical protein